MHTCTQACTTDTHTHTHMYTSIHIHTHIQAQLWDNWKLTVQDGLNQTSIDGFHFPLVNQTPLTEAILLTNLCAVHFIQRKKKKKEKKQKHYSSANLFFGFWIWSYEKETLEREIKKKSTHYHTHHHFTFWALLMALAFRRSFLEGLSHFSDSCGSRLTFISLTRASLHR